MLTVSLKPRLEEIAYDDAWKRVAAVTDVEWLGKAVQAFRWLMPGEVRVFGHDELDAAKAWVAD